MSTPSKATIFTEWANAVKILDESRKWGHVNTPNLLGLLDTLEQSYQGNYLDDVESAVEAIRNALAGSLSSAAWASVQRPWLKEFMTSVVGRSTLGSDLDMLQEMYKYFIDNNERVQSRVITYGSPTASGTPVGNGQILRLTKDQFNQNIENIFLDQKRAICIADYQTGTARGAETFLIRGQVPQRDDIKRSGSGIDAIINGKTADDSLLFNASFDNIGSGTAAAPTGIANWLSSAGDSSSVYTFDSTNFFRPAPSVGSGTSYALDVVASTTLSQKLSVSGKKLRMDRPYILAVIWNRQVYSATGTLLIQMGSQTNSVTVNTQTGWIVSTVPSATAQGCWYRNMAQDDINIQLNWTRTGGTGLLIDEVLLLEGQPHDNTFYWAIPNSAAAWVPWRVNDTYLWADQGTATSKIQNALWRGFGFYAPSSNGSSVTFADV